MDLILDKLNNSKNNKKKDETNEYEETIKQINNDGILNLYKEFYLNDIPKINKQNNQKNKFLHHNQKIETNLDFYENINNEIFKKNQDFFNNIFN